MPYRQALDLEVTSMQKVYSEAVGNARHDVGHPYTGGLTHLP